MLRLSDEIPAEVQLHSLGDIGTLMKLVQEVEDRNWVLGESEIGNQNRW